MTEDDAGELRVLGQYIPSAVWTKLADHRYRDLEVFQQSGRNQQVTYHWDGSVALPAGPEWRIRLPESETGCE